MAAFGNKIHCILIAREERVGERLHQKNANWA
jgi:hypothetical protein